MIIKSGIYQITNILNGKFYVGSSKYIKHRLSGHKSNLKHNIHGNTKLQNSYNKHGISNFKFEILFYCEIKDLLFYEQLCIDKFDCVKSGFNILMTAGSPLGMKFGPASEETKLKISEKARQRPPPSEDQKLAISKTLMGYTRTEESRLKQSLSSKGSKKPIKTAAQLLVTKELRRKLRQDKLLKEKELYNEQG